MFEAPDMRSNTETKGAVRKKRPRVLTVVVLCLDRLASLFEQVLGDLEAVILQSESKFRHLGSHFLQASQFPIKHLCVNLITSLILNFFNLILITFFSLFVF